MEFTNATPEELVELLRETDDVQITELEYGGKTVEPDSLDYCRGLLDATEDDIEIAGTILSENSTPDNEKAEDSEPSGRENVNVTLENQFGECLLAFALLEPTTYNDVWRFLGGERSSVHGAMSRLQSGGFIKETSRVVDSSTVRELTESGRSFIESEFGGVDYISAGFFEREYTDIDLTPKDFQVVNDNFTMGSVEKAVIFAIEELDSLPRGNLTHQDRLGVTSDELDDFLDHDSGTGGTVHNLKTKGYIRFSGKKGSYRSYCITPRGKRKMNEVDFDKSESDLWPVQTNEYRLD